MLQAQVRATQSWLTTIPINLERASPEALKAMAVSWFLSFDLIISKYYKSPAQEPKTK